MSSSFCKYFCVTLLRQSVKDHEGRKPGNDKDQQEWRESGIRVLVKAEMERDKSEAEKKDDQRYPNIGVNVTKLILELLTVLVAGAAAYFVYRQVVTLTNSERSWVLADVEDFTVKDMLLCEAAGSDAGLVFCRLKNYGIKPVWIIAVSCNLKIVASATELPEEPDYGDWKPFEGQLPLLPESAGRYVRRPLVISIAEFQSVLAKKRELYVYGFATYKDAFGLLRESRFCFNYVGNPPCFQPGGPKNYNRYC